MSLIAKNTHVQESTHWYTMDGAPQYTVPSKKDGSPRNTTLRDARKMNLVPSVTTILGVSAKPALINWLQQQVLMAALTLPKRTDELEKDYIDRIIQDSKEQGRSAADEGTRIHESIQGHYEGKLTVKHREHIQGTVNAVEAHYSGHKWICERSFAHTDLKFGGKCDMHSTKDYGIVIDIKTKEFTDPDKVEGYDEHLMQLAAYRVGLGIPEARCANVFVSRNVPGLVVVKEWEHDDLIRGWKMFMALLQYWQLKNKLEDTTC